MAQSYTYTQTRDEIVTHALRKIGVLEQGETATGSQLLDGGHALISILKELNHMAACKWLIATTTLTLTNATYSYTTPAIAADIHELIYATFRDAAGTDHPIEIIDAMRYASIPLKSLANPIDRVYLSDNSVLANRTMYVNPAPATVTTEKIFYAYEATVTIPGLGTDTLVIPSGWLRYLTLRLASDVAHEYSIGVTEIDMLEKKVDKTLNFLLIDSLAHYQKVAAKKLGV